jgi:hypothetical protein
MATRTKPRKLRAGNSSEVIEGNAATDPVQDRINRMILKHGKTVTEWGNFADILEEEGLTAADVTPHKLQEAETFFVKRVKQATKGEIFGQELHWCQPAKEKTDLADWDVWQTGCGRYRVVRSVSTCNDEHSFRVTYRNGGGIMRTLDRHFKSLARAFEGAEEKHSQEVGAAFVVSNKDKIVSQAKAAGLSELPARTETQSGEDVMKLTEKEARDLFAACGVPDAVTNDDEGKPKWNVSKLGKRLNSFHEVDGVQEPADAESLKLYKKVLAAAGKKPIEIEGAEKNGKPEPGKRKVKEGNPDKKPAKAKKAEGGPSNKEQVYRLFEKKADVSPDDCFKKVEERVKLTTIRAWLSEWKRGSNLPSCAKAK